MTGSAGQGGRRECLVTAALELVYRQGVAQTSLAEVAEAAGAPVGLIYYYFKTKDALIEAVIEAHAAELQAMFASFSEHHNPRERLTAFLRSRALTGELAARWGARTGA
jgi:TetR/AcrR family transcriptional regulator, transcriptional repressor for nem operon